MFIDTAKINIIAGRGGDGVNSFYRDKLTRKGHPDGGDGGNGGNVIIRVSTNVHTLVDFQYRQHFRAKDGKNGSSKQKRGADGLDCTISAPSGTLIYDDKTGVLIADLTKDGEEILVAKGGRRGKGNRSHKDATIGGAGEEKAVRLELKLIADVGIIGFPNSGKSTLISKISNAHPKIAPYPFTTKAPVLGVVRRRDFEFRVCEVPGLIKDAHKGKGLGDLFLRHIERTKILVHLVDMAESARGPLYDYQDLNQELTLYGKGLDKKYKILAANKMDIKIAGENLKIFSSKVKDKIFPISSKTKEGIGALIEEICYRLKHLDKKNAQG